MAQSSTEDLRKLLENELNTPGKNVSRTNANDLASLIESLNVDLFQSKGKGKSPRAVETARSSRPLDYDLETTSVSSLNTRWKQPSNADSDNSFVHLSEREYETRSGSASLNGANNVEKDSLDYSVVRFGADYVLRGKLGRYLAAVPTTVAVEPIGISTHPTKTNASLGISSLEISGQGIGEPIDCLNFINADKKYVQRTHQILLPTLNYFVTLYLCREDLGHIRYGSTVAIKSPAAKERCSVTYSTSSILSPLQQTFGS
jgi:hypothetical protein